MERIIIELDDLKKEKKLEEAVTHMSLCAVKRFVPKCGVYLRMKLRIENLLVIHASVGNIYLALLAPFLSLQDAEIRSQAQPRISSVREEKDESP